MDTGLQDIADSLARGNKAVETVVWCLPADCRRLVQRIARRSRDDAVANAIPLVVVQTAPLYSDCDLFHCVRVTTRDYRPPKSNAKNGFVQCRPTRVRLASGAAAPTVFVHCTELWMSYPNMVVDLGTFFQVEPPDRLDVYDGDKERPPGDIGDTSNHGSRTGLSGADAKQLDGRPLDDLKQLDQHDGGLQVLHPGLDKVLVGSRTVLLPGIRYRALPMPDWINYNRGLFLLHGAAGFRPSP